MAQREPLSTARLIAAAASVADRGGLSAVSMRNVGAELGVEAMSLYHHVANKAALLDGLADWIFERFELPPDDAPWRQAMAVRAASMREVLGDEFINVYESVKRNEYKEFLQVISPWEREHLLLNV